MPLAPRQQTRRPPRPAFSFRAAAATASGALRLALLWLCAAQALAQDPFQTLPAPPAAHPPESSIPSGELPEPASDALAESPRAPAPDASAEASGGWRPGGFGPGGLPPGACRPVAVLVVDDRGLALCRLGASYHRVGLGAVWPGTDSRLVYIGAGGRLLLRDAEGAERALRPG